MTASKPLPRNSRFLAEWLFLLAALLVLGGYIGYSQYQEHQWIQVQQQERLASQAELIEKNLLPELSSANRILEGMLEDLPGWMAQGHGGNEVNKRLQRISTGLTGVSLLLVVNAQGRVMACNVGRLVGFDVSGRDYFQEALGQRDPRTLFVSAPFSSALGQASISLVRKITGSQGQFGGVVLAVLNPEFFAVLLDSVRYTPDVWTYLAHGDGKLFMRVPEQKELIGQDLSALDRFFSRHRQSSQLTSLFSGLASASGPERLIAFRSIQPASLAMDKPLVLTISRDLKTIFADWQRQSILHGQMFALLALVACLSLYFFQRRQAVFDQQARSREQALQASEARLQSFFDATPDALLISDAHGTITMANQQIQHLLGFTVEELIGQSIERLVPDRFQAMHPALRSGYAAELTTRRMGQGRAVKARRKDGTECQVEVSLSRIQTADGLFFACALRDITQRKQAEADLRIAATAFESQEGMVVTDARGTILRINRAFSEITGYSAQEVIGHNPSLLQSKRHNPDFYRAMWETIHRTGGWQGEIWDRRKNGDDYPKWLTISAVKGDDGVVTHYVGTHFDITERKKKEEKIKELAFFDPLTGLPNRTLLLDRLKQAMTASARNASYGALLFLDLDNFKTLNDTLGHDMGDLLLKQVAQRLAACVREGDTVARQGGDEFVVVLAGLSPNESEAAVATEMVAEKILAALSQP